MDEYAVKQRLARRIKRLREAAGLSQKKLGERVGQELGWHVAFPASRIGEIERGKRDVQRHEQGAIARALGTTEAELFADLGYSGEAAAVTGEGQIGAQGGGSVELVRGKSRPPRS